MNMTAEQFATMSVGAVCDKLISDHLGGPEHFRRDLQSKPAPAITLSKELYLTRHTDSEPEDMEPLEVSIEVFGEYLPYRAATRTDPEEGGCLEVDSWTATLSGGLDVSDFFTNQEVTQWAQEDYEC